MMDSLFLSALPPGEHESFIMLPLRQAPVQEFAEAVNF